MSNPKVSIGLDTIRIECGGQVICLDSVDIYKQLHHQMSKDRIRTILADKGYAPETINTLVDDDFVQRWICSNKGNSSINECEMLAAILIAFDKENELNKQSAASTAHDGTGNHTEKYDPVTNS